MIMNNFHYNVPTEIFFGKGAIENLNQIAHYGKRVLLVCGKDSIKKMGLYDEVVRILEQLDMDFFELSGVDPNPRIESARSRRLRRKSYQAIVSSFSHVPPIERP
jgi:alcohol dehydrogenase YqhD (iron-dependent ADH family)